MPNDERTPLLTEQPATQINKHAPPTDEEARIKDSAAASTAPDGPKIPGVNLGLILPAMAVGVCFAFSLVPDEVPRTTTGSLCFSFVANQRPVCLRFS